MKTKNIFKTLAFAMLMPIMLLTTSCSSEDDALNNTTAAESTVTKGYAFPVTVSATRQGDGATTRATYNSETKKLEFSAGDKLYVSGNNATAGKFAGTLDYVSDGKFSGTITTENEYSGTVDDLFAEFVYAILLPKDYASYGFFTYTENNGYDAALGLDYSYAFALTKAAAVEQFSVEFGTYSSGFALNPMCAVLNFTINGLAASTEVAVVLRFWGRFQECNNRRFGHRNLCHWRVTEYRLKQLHPDGGRHCHHPRQQQQDALCRQDLQHHAECGSSRRHHQPRRGSGYRQRRQELCR